MLSFSSPPYVHLFIQTCKDTKDVSALTKAADFVKAFVLGFQVEVSLLRLGNAQCECFGGWIIFQTFELSLWCLNFSCKNAACHCHTSTEKALMMPTFVL